MNRPEPTASSGVPLAAAARELGASQATVRRWIARGAPTISPGGPGRGHGAIVDPEALRRWRYGEAHRRDDTDTVAQLAQTFLDFFRYNSGVDAPAHKSLGIPDREAAALLVTLFEYTARRILGREPGNTPAQIAQLCAVCLNSGHRKTGGEK